MMLLVKPRLKSVADRVLSRLATQGRFKGSRELAVDWHASTGTNASARTVRRRLVNDGLKSYRPAKKPFFRRGLTSSIMSFYHVSNTTFFTIALSSNFSNAKALLVQGNNACTFPRCIFKPPQWHFAAKNVLFLQLIFLDLLSFTPKVEIKYSLVPRFFYHT